MPLWNSVSKASILVVDDLAENRRLMDALLRDEFEVRLADSGPAALQLAATSNQPDLILLDVMMPGLDGFEVCRALKADARTRDIPVVFLTAMNAAEDESRALALGAVDYITKPINPPVCLSRVRTHARLKRAADFLKDQNAFLEREVERRTEELSAVQDVTIMVMASLAETRDNDTGNHIRRTQLYVKALAEHLRQHPRFCDYLTDQQIATLYKSAPLHDIGKVGIPDHILLKPGAYEPHEYEVMKSHCQLGRDAIEAAEEKLGIRAEFLNCAKEIAYSHQEWWDGSGYPQGLRGDQIPASARLMAVADVYDALICRRVYKDSMPHEQAVEHIRRGSGSHFDPDVVEAFIAISEQFRSIATQHADTDADLERKIRQLEAVAERITL